MQQMAKPSKSQIITSTADGRLETAVVAKPMAAMSVATRPPTDGRMKARMGKVSVALYASTRATP